jgi:hypothetical protein
VLAANKGVLALLFTLSIHHILCRVGAMAMISRGVRFNFWRGNVTWRSTMTETGGVSFFGSTRGSTPSMYLDSKRLRTGRVFAICNA